MRRAVLLLPLLALASGCGSSSEAASGNAGTGAGGAYTGGQTGSLIPNCGIAPLSEEGGTVPSGEQALVFYTRGCPQVQAADLVITDADGQPIDLEVEELGDGAYLVKATASFAEGAYTVEPPDMQGQAVALEVAAPAPLPTRLGEAVADTSTCEGLDFSVQLDEAVLPYLSLMRFELSVDDGEPFLWGDYGSLIPLSSGKLLGFLPYCSSTGCIELGRHELRITGTIAGETAQPDPTALSFTVDCVQGQTQAAASSYSDDSDHGRGPWGCALISSRQRQPPSDAGIALMALLALLGVLRLRGGKTRH